MTALFSCRDIIENLTTAIVVMDNALRINTLNSAAEVLFGMSERQASSIPIQSFLLSNSALLAGLNRVKDTGLELIEREIKLYIPSRGEVLVDCSIKFIENSEAQPSILLELSQLEFQQRISREESLNTQQQVLRGLAHEVKNPLGGLRGAAQLLERQLDSAELKEYTTIIISEADRLQNLMTKMLGSHHMPEPEQVNIHEILQRVRQLVSSDTDSRLELVGDYDPSIPDLYVDFDQMVQVFLNIILNAVQALDGAGRIILRTRVLRNITIEQTPYRLGVCIEVEDNGPGVPAELHESIFFPMVTGRAEGTGLGLYLVQSLINRNNGMISCASQPQHTVFSVIFPLETSNG
ncbi:MAG: PAS domain-containing sensor histidine kinase [Gammaproteobacteria bacterium]|nr:MAG: PAS domain-containing sensor histidine kinase [Gammaproteobacteria bacterium]